MRFGQKRDQGIAFAMGQYLPQNQREDGRREQHIARELVQVSLDYFDLDTTCMHQLTFFQADQLLAAADSSFGSRCQPSSGKRWRIGGFCCCGK